MMVMRSHRWAIGAGVCIVANYAHAEDTIYTVKKGDTCAAIAARFYGDSRMVDVIHEANPGMGTPPHNLAEGRTLRLPPKPIGKVAAPDAIITALRNKVEVQAPEPKPAKKEDPLFKGNRVGTKESSAADLLFRDESQLRLGEHTLVVILGDVQSRASKVGEASLVTGSLRARLGELAGRKDIDVPTGKVSIGRGEAKVSVDDKKSARLAVYKGQSDITSQKKTVSVPENFGSKADLGRPPSPPKPLPGAPNWTNPPASLSFVKGDTAVVTGDYGPTGAVAVAAYRVQLAYDADFSDVLVDTRVPAAVTHLETHATHATGYFVRVSAIDADEFEGPFSVVHPVRVVAPPVTRLPGYTLGIAPLPGASCAVDGGELMGPRALSSLTSHRLTCALADKRGAATVDVPAARPKVLRLYGGRVTPEGRLRVWLLDEKNERVPASDAVFVSDHPGVEISSVVPDGASPGAYVLELKWSGFVRNVRISVNAAGMHGEPTASLVLPPKVEPLTPAKERPSIELEAGGGGLASTSDLGGRLFFGLGPRFPVEKGYFALGARVGFEGYKERFDVVAPAGLSSPSMTHQAVAIGAPFAFRYGTRDARFSPYLGVMPELLLQQSTLSSRTRAPQDGSAILFGLTGYVGASYALGPGALFLELGYRGTSVSEYDVAKVKMTGATLNLGYRFSFGR